MEKDKTLDFLRVISMFLVIVIHLANCYARSYAEISGVSFMIADIFNILARVSVPIFFMISGALLIPKVLTKDKYIYRIKRMIIILTLWTFIYLIFEYFYMNKTTNILSLLIEPSRTHLWFMYAIIAIYIALPFISKLAKNLTKNEENLFIGLWFISSIFIFIVRRVVHADIVYDIPIISGTYYLGYFLIGHIIYKRIKDHKTKCKKYNNYLMGIFIFANIVIFMITVLVSFKTNSNYKGFLTYSNPFMIASSISIYIYLLINVKRIPKLITYLAPFSFGIYLVHGIFLEIIKNNISLVRITPLIGVPLFSIFLFIISYFVIYFIKKIPKINKYIC